MSGAVIANRFYPQVPNLITIDELPDFSSFAELMDITYLTQLNNYPSITSKTGKFVFTLQPLSLDEIVSLEAAYNNGNQFPTALRELLYIAGKICYVLDYGVNDTQEQMQANVRNWLARENMPFTRLFFAIDVYNAPSQFLFVYLDEGVADPIVYEAVLGEDEPIVSLNVKLSDYLNGQLAKLLSGYNPF